MTCDDATWVDLKSEYDLSVMLRALASKGGSSYDSIGSRLLLHAENSVTSEKSTGPKDRVSGNRSK